MTAFLYFTKRNLKNYFRSRGSVFASLLTMIILIVLMLVFLGDVYGSDISSAVLAFNPSLDAEAVESDSSYFMLLWTLGGVLAINTVTVTSTSIGAMVTDETEKKIQSFYAAPVKRWILTVSYIFSAWLISIIMSVFTLAVAEAVLAIGGNPLLSALQLAKLLGLIAASSVTFSCIGYLIASFIHSGGAWTVFLTVTGTLVGFAGGCYVPVSMLSEPIQAVLKFMPFLHSTAMMRTVCLENISNGVFADVPASIMETVNAELGNTIVIGSHTVTFAEQLLIFLAYTIICLGIAILITRKRRLKTA